MRAMEDKEKTVGVGLVGGFGHIHILTHTFANIYGPGLCWTLETVEEPGLVSDGRSSWMGETDRSA